MTSLPALQPTEDIPAPTRMAPTRESYERLYREPRSCSCQVWERRRKAAGTVAMWLLVAFLLAVNAVGWPMFGFLLYELPKVVNG